MNYSNVSLLFEDYYFIIMKLKDSPYTVNFQSLKITMLEITEVNSIKNVLLVSPCLNEF